MEVSTGCRTEEAARQVLANLERRMEHIKSGIMTPEQDAMACHQGTPLSEHLDRYIAHLEAKSVTPGRVHQTRRRIERVARDCRFVRLADLKAEPMEGWLAARQKEKMSAGTRNVYRSSVVAFGNWCKRTSRLMNNPFANLPKANEKADPRRTRRALNEQEIARLLEVARQRPVIDKMTIRRGKRKGQVLGKLLPKTQRRLERLGRERALIYKTLVLTGLRKNELASLTVGQLDLDGPLPQAELHAADEKNRQGSSIPLRTDLAADLRQWLAEKLVVLQEAASKAKQPIPVRLPADTPLFWVADDLVRILGRDLVLAGMARKVTDPVTGKTRIDTRDERGWTIDVHALRKTFGTLLSRRGVAPRTAQAAMRHSTINLTMNLYTDPRLLDVAAAMDALPELPLKTGTPASSGQAVG